MPLKTHVDAAPELNLTSMIDVVFLLIIFFMVGTKFTEMERAIDLQVPQVADSGALTDAPVDKVINVQSDGAITLEREPLTLTELQTKLVDARQLYPDLGVLVRGDGAASYRTVAEVFNVCKQAGVVRMGMAVRIEKNVR